MSECLCKCECHKAEKKKFWEIGLEADSTDFKENSFNTEAKAIIEQVKKIATIDYMKEKLQPEKK